MTYLSIPKQLTEQELELQRKFAVLRKLKKQLATLKSTNSRADDQVKASLKRTQSDTAEAATEQAKKLLKSGAIKVDISAKAKQFKRARIEKLSLKDGADRQTSVAGYQPYQNTESALDHSDGEGQPTPSPRLSRGRIDPAHHEHNIRRGPKIYVKGDGLNEQMLQEVFSKAGTVLKTSMEQGKNSGFVTFDTVESAEEAVSQFNGSFVRGVKLDVEIARRQGSGFVGREKLEAKKVEPKTVAVSRDVVKYDDSNLFD